MPWEKPVPHHKWADELEEEKRVKDALKTAKKEAKAEDHSKECPFCYHKPVTPVPPKEGTAPDDPIQTLECYVCGKCDRLYAVKCPGTILLDGNPVIVQGSGR